MKAASAAFKTMLATYQTLFGCDLYTITLVAGTILRYTSGPRDIVFEGNTYLCAKSGVVPGFSRGNIKLAIGLMVENIEVNIVFDSTTFILSTTPSAFANAGGFDNARVKIDKLLTPDQTFQDVSRGVINLYNGVVTDVHTTNTKCQLNVASDMISLNAQFPRNYFLPSCNNSLFDGGCGLNKESLAVTATCTAGNTVKTLTASGLTQPSEYFALGYVVVLTGVNAGLVRSVKASVSGSLSLLYPLPVACANGDTFKAYPGCNKTQATCRDKFSNLGRFRGFPFVPTMEQIELGSAGTAPPDSGNNGGGGLIDLGRGPGGGADFFQQ